jgi:hypothetical protein
LASVVLRKQWQLRVEVRSLRRQAVLSPELAGGEEEAVELAVVAEVGAVAVAADPSADPRFEGLITLTSAYRLIIYLIP